MARTFNRPIAGTGIVSILIFIDIDQAVGPKIYGIGTGRIAAVILIWIKYPEMFKPNSKISKEILEK